MQKSSRQILDYSKLKDFADDNLEFDENGRKFSKWVENTVEKEKLLVTSNFFFSHTVFKRHALQTRKNLGLFGKGFIVCLDFYGPFLFINEPWLVLSFLFGL